MNSQFSFATESLFPIMFAINLMFGLVLFTVFRREDNNAVLFWMSACFVFCLGGLLISTRNYLPVVIGYSLSNSLILLSHYLNLRSIEIFNYGKSRRYLWAELFCIIYGLGFIFIKQKNSPELVASYVSICNFVFQIWIFIKLISMRGFALNKFSNLIAYCYLVGSLIWLLRLYLSKVYSFGESTDPGFANWLTLLTLVLILLLRHFFFLALLLTKSSQQLNNISELIHEKDQLMIELAHEKSVAELANKAKGQFLANVSHEVRTPLHGLIGMVSILLKSTMTEEIKKSLDKVLYSSKALLFILNDILEFSKIDAGIVKIHNEPFVVKNLLNDVVDFFSIPIASKNIDLRLEIDPSIPHDVKGDFYKLRQVLFNLIGNSIKFTETGYVMVKARLDHLDGQWVTFTLMVIDTGIGISPNDIEEIFKPFNQIDNTNTRKYDGIGLGLSISQSILKNMGSELVMKSQQNIGTEASFQLRLERSLMIESKPPLLKNQQITSVSFNFSSLEGHHILVVEDNLINIEVLRQYLNFLKIKVDCVTDGLLCLDALQNHQYDLILMDIQIPNLDGIQTTKKIRAMNQFTDIPIIGLSAGFAKKDREIGLESGMNDFLVKPFEVEDLAKLLMRYIKQS